MTLNEKALTSPQPGKATAETRLEALAAIWARQTGRPIVVTPPGDSVR